MSPFVSRLIAAWPPVAKRSLSHWRLLSSVAAGVLLASAIMSGTVIYFDSLRDLALQNILAKLTTGEANILAKADRGPTSFAEYEKVSRAVNEQVDSRLAWFLRDRIPGGKTATFFLTVPGEEDSAGKDDARAYFTFQSRLAQHVTLRPGGRPPRERALSKPGEPLLLEAMVPVEAAEPFGVGVGDVLSAVPYWEDATPYARVVISGLFDRNDPDDEFWELNEGVFRTSLSGPLRILPFHISETTFMDVLGGAFRDMDSTYGWLLSVDRNKLNSRNAASALANINLMERRLSTELSSYLQITSLDEVLSEYDERLFFSKLPMFVILILIVVVILYYVVTLSSLLVDQQRSELALLRSRGASSGQIIAVFVLEGTTISLLAIVVAPVMAAIGIGLLGLTPAFSGLSEGARLPVTVSGGAYMMSALGGALSFGALMIPAIQASRIGVATHRQQAARPAGQPFFQRYYLDILLLVVGIFLFRQLSEQGSVVATGLFGEVRVDQALLAVPAVILVAVAMVLLRLFPLALGLGSRLLSPLLPAGLMLGLWQMARNPTHYARLSLLLILMAGLGILAASFGGTLQRSFKQRALYSTGADIRLEGITLNTHGTSVPVAGSYEEIPGVVVASPVFRGTGSDLSKRLGKQYTTLAVDGQVFGEIAWFRDDFSDKALEELLPTLVHPDRPRGIEIPEEAHSIGVRIKSDRPHPGVAVAARMRDANGRYFTYPLGRLQSSGWTELGSSLLRVRRFGRQSLKPVKPLTLVSLSVHETNRRNRLRAGAFSIDNIHVRTGAGVQIIEPFDDVAGWSPLRAAAESMSDAFQLSSPTSRGGSGVATFTWTEGSPATGRGVFHGPPISPLPVLANGSFLSDSGRSVGEKFELFVQGHRVPVRLADTIDYFPTLDSQDVGEGFLVLDLPSLIRYGNLDPRATELKPNEIWLSTELTGPSRRQLIETLESKEPFFYKAIHDRESVVAGSRVDPLVDAGWRALLFIAFASVLLLSGIGFLVHAYVSFRSREIQFALMRTIGLSTKQLIMLVWLEQVLVIAVGMALGTWMGRRIGAIIMPYLGHDDQGSQVVPPFIIEVNWGTLGITYAATALVFALIIGGMIWFIRRISLQHTLRLGE